MTETPTLRVPRPKPREDAAASAIPDDARAIVERWCAANRDRIVACYLTPRRDHLLVAVIGTAIEYDNDLGDDVAGLEGCLLDIGCRAESTLLPNLPVAELTYFIHPSTSVRVDAE